MKTFLSRGVVTMTTSPSRPKVEYTTDCFTDAEHWCWVGFKKFQKASDTLDILKEHSKDYLAVLMTQKELERPDIKLSDTKLERLARAGDAWKKNREEYADAVQKYGEARVTYYTAVRFWDTVQSGLAYNRESLKKLGG